MKTIIFWSIVLIFGLTSCQNPDPNADKSGNNGLKSLELKQPINERDLAFSDTIYVPIYSHIYVDAQNQESLLAATLSVRNTSFTDSIFITQIDYFNTSGVLVRSFLEHDISLPPMASVNYVIEKEDRSGGSGANFIVSLKAKNDRVKPRVQAVMIGHYSNKGFSFTSEGFSIKN